MVLVFVTGVIILSRTERGGNICGSVRQSGGERILEQRKGSGRDR